MKSCKNSSLGILMLLIGTKNQGRPWGFPEVEKEISLTKGHQLQSLGAVKPALKNPYSWPLQAQKLNREALGKALL